MSYFYSNETVFRGHPDKVCDQISDTLVYEYLKGDPLSRCGIECMGGKGKIFITGEVSSNYNFDIVAKVREVLYEVGYKDCLDWDIINNLSEQSADIALGTNTQVMGAGDQGMMFGFATNETEEMLPMAQVILQKLARKYDMLRKMDTRFLADGKAQITGEYDEKTHKLLSIKTFVISYQNTEKERELTDQILKNVAKEICDEYRIDIQEFKINPTGKFNIGGFIGDSGLTGRKIVVDTYHSFAPVGGGAFSGKDGTKVDRSAAYKAREIAKRYVEKYGYDSVLVQLSYAIGIKEPVGIYVKIKHNGEKIKLDTTEFIKECSVDNLVTVFNNIYLEQIKDFAAFGHFRR